MVGFTDGHGQLRFQLSATQRVVGFFELLILVIFGIIGAHHAQAGQILTGNAIQIVGKALNAPEFGNRIGHDRYDDHEQKYYGARSEHRPFKIALALNFADSHDGHDRRFYDYL